MFTLRPSERQMPVDDVVAFIDLMHRWPFQTALKFAHEFYHGNLVGSWVNSWVRDGANYYVIISEGMCWEQNQAYACANLHRLTYLREDIERIEAQNPRYRDDVHDAMYDEFLLGRCTKKNVAQLAPEILHILQNLYWDYCVVGKKPFPHPHVIKMWLQGDDIFHTDLSIPGPKKNWRVKPEKMVPIFQKDTLIIRLPKKKTTDYARLEEFAARQREQGFVGVDLGFKLLQIEPELSNSSLIRLAYPTTSFTTKKQKDAARQAGARLRIKISKHYASKNSHT